MWVFLRDPVSVQKELFSLVVSLDILDSYSRFVLISEASLNYENSQSKGKTLERTNFQTESS